MVGAHRVGVKDQIVRIVTSSVTERGEGISEIDGPQAGGQGWRQGNGQELGPDGTLEGLALRAGLIVHLVHPRRLACFRVSPKRHIHPCAMQ